MTKTVRCFYKGWDVEVHCAKQKRTLLQLLRPAEFAAVGTATLRGANKAIDWVDSRQQTASTGNRLFYSHVHCCDLLVTEIMTLIDGLQR